MFNPSDNLVRLAITAISLFLGRGSNEPCDRLPPSPKVSEKKELEPTRLSLKPMLLIKHKNERLFLRDKLSRQYCQCSGEEPMLSSLAITSALSPVCLFSSVQEWHQHAQHSTLMALWSASLGLTGCWEQPGCQPKGNCRTQCPQLSQLAQRQRNHLVGDHPWEATSGLQRPGGLRECI